MNRALFATSFANEQGAAAPTRIDVSSEAVLTHSVTAAGYTVSGTLQESQSLRLQLPEVRASERYVKYSAMITDANVTSDIQVFGLSLQGTTLDPAQPYHVCVVSDTQGQARAYVNDRFVGEVQAQSAVQVTSVGAFSFNVTDLLVCESATREPIGVEFVDLVVTEVENVDWLYSGDTLIDSLDKDNATAVDPNATSYLPGSRFVVDTSTTLPMLVETAGSITEDADKYALVARNPDGADNLLEPLGEQRALQGVLLAAGQVEIQRTARPDVFHVDSRQPLTINLVGAESVKISFGDGSTLTDLNGNVLRTHNFAPDLGVVAVYIYGKADSVEVAGLGLREVEAWGNLEASRYAFNFNRTVTSPALQHVPSYLPEAVTSTAFMFYGATAFNSENVVPWRTGSVVQMQGMFEGAAAFNQDLSHWCVEQIPQKPENFDTDTEDNWALGKPVWGTCPEP